MKSCSVPHISDLLLPMKPKSSTLLTHDIHQNMSHMLSMCKAHDPSSAAKEDRERNLQHLVTAACAVKSLALTTGLGGETGGSPEITGQLVLLSQQAPSSVRDPAFKGGWRVVEEDTCD